MTNQLDDDFETILRENNELREILNNLIFKKAPRYVIFGTGCCVEAIQVSAFRS